MDIFKWFTSNWKELTEAVGLIIAGASIIVKATPTLKDDNILLPVIKFLGKWIALNRTINDDELRKTPDLPLAGSSDEHTEDPVVE
jgi:hypothetical protein